MLVFGLKVNTLSDCFINLLFKYFLIIGCVTCSKRSLETSACLNTEYYDKETETCKPCPAVCGEDEVVTRCKKHYVLCCQGNVWETGKSNGNPLCSSVVVHTETTVSSHVVQKGNTSTGTSTEPGTTSTKISATTSSTVSPLPGCGLNSSEKGNQERKEPVLGSTGLVPSINESYSRGPCSSNPDDLRVGCSAGHKCGEDSSRTNATMLFEKEIRPSPFERRISIMIHYAMLCCLLFAPGVVVVAGAGCR